MRPKTASKIATLGLTNVGVFWEPAVYCVFAGYLITCFVACWVCFVRCCRETLHFECFIFSCCLSMRQFHIMKGAEHKADVQKRARLDLYFIFLAMLCLALPFFTAKMSTVLRNKAYFLYHIGFYNCEHAFRIPRFLNPFPFQSLSPSPSPFHLALAFDHTILRYRCGAFLLITSNAFSVPSSYRNYLHNHYENPPYLLPHEDLRECDVVAKNRWTCMMV